MRLSQIWLVCSIALASCSTAKTLTPMGAMYWLPKMPASMTPPPPGFEGYTGPVFKGIDKSGKVVLMKPDSDKIVVWPEELKLREQECRQ